MFKKIFNDLFSPGTLQAESTTHTASASLSADTILELEARKMAIVADITRLAAELASHPDLGAPVGSSPIGVGTLTGAPALAVGCANPAAAAEWFGRPAPWTGERAYTRPDLAAKLHEAGLAAERAAEARGKGLKR